MVGRERERDTPPIRTPYEADRDRHGRGVAYSATERGTTFRSRAAWEHMDPSSSSSTHRRNWDDPPRDRPRADANWSRKPRQDLKQGRNFGRSDQRYHDLDRTERLDRSDGREPHMFSEPSAQDSNGRSSYHPDSALDYSEPVANRPVPSRRGSRWDVGPQDGPVSKKPTTSWPPRGDPVSQKYSHSANSGIVTDPARSHPTQAGATHPTSTPHSTAEAHAASLGDPHASPDTKSNLQADMLPLFGVEKSVSEIKAPSIKHEAVASSAQSASSSAPLSAEKRSLSQEPAIMSASSDRFANEAPTRSESRRLNDKQAPDSQQDRNTTSSVDSAHLSTSHSDQGDPQKRTDAAEKVVADNNEPSEGIEQSSPLTPVAPIPSAAGSSALSRSLKNSSGPEEDTIEQEILATEQILRAAEHASHEALNKETEPVMHEQSATGSTTLPHIEVNVYEPGSDAPEASAISVVSVAKQLFAAGPTLSDQVHDIFLENQRQTQRNQTTTSALESVCRQTPMDDCKVPMEILQQDTRERREAREAKESMLRAEYRRMHAAWNRYCRHLDGVYERREQQRRASSGAAQDDDSQTAATPTLFGTPTPVRGSRRGVSGSGDAVRSEAEFLEILASLENAEMQDPNARAARTAATIPDMHIHVIGDPMLIDYDDGYVADFGKMYFPEFDPDVWSEEERDIFAKRYALYPKQFGQIARGLPHKTAQQCVVYYYLHKRLPGYDFKVFGTKGRERKRKARRPKKAKGSALMADIAAGSEAQRDPEVLAESDKRNKRRNEEDSNVIQQESKATSPPNSSKRPRVEPNRKISSASMVGETNPKSSVEDAAAGLSQLAQASEPRSTSASQWETDRELAAAEALEALAGTTPSSDNKRVRQPKKEEDSSDVQGRSRGPHWSMAERAEFLRLLALHGKDWTALATAFPSKSAAQTRNFFARHANESSHFQAAANLAVNNAQLPLEERSALAVKFVNDWYSTLPENVQSSIDGWPADSASFMRADAEKPWPVARDDDETDDEGNGSEALIAATPRTEVTNSVRGRSMRPSFAEFESAGTSNPSAHSGAQRVTIPPHAYNSRYDSGVSSTRNTTRTSPTAMSSARGMHDGVPCGYPTNPYAQAYREGYDRYSMYAYPGAYRPEFAAHRDERPYEPMYLENISERRMPNVYESSPHIPSSQTGAIYPPLSRSQSPIRSRSPISLRPSSAERKQGSYPRANYLQTHAESNERPDAFYETSKAIRRPPFPPGPNYGYFTSPRTE